MIVERLGLVDFRNYAEASFELGAGMTVVVGDNGQGKTNLAEAIAYLATLSSFRGAPPEALVRDGAPSAVVRADVLDDDGRESVVEAEVALAGRSRVKVNRQRLVRTRDLLGVVRVTVFSPDDLTLVKGGPSERRRFLDDTLVALAVKYDAMRLELDRIVRQRNTLLRQVAGRLDESEATTLDVWDAKLTETGERLGHARATLVERLRPLVAEAYDDLAGGCAPSAPAAPAPSPPGSLAVARSASARSDASHRMDGSGDRADLAGSPTAVGLAYDAAWRCTGLAAALADARSLDVRRGVSTVGPHRDEVTMTVASLPARTHASQGEQRTLALALRLAAHRLVADRTGSTPVLVLDDVLSELDHGRAAALLGHLPAGQVVITTAGPIPPAAAPDRVLRIVAGRVDEVLHPSDRVRGSGAPEQW